MHRIESDYLPGPFQENTFFNTESINVNTIQFILTIHFNNHHLSLQSRHKTTDCLELISISTALVTVLRQVVLKATDHGVRTFCAHTL